MSAASNAQGKPIDAPQGPVAPSGRIVEIDALRGFAILGILLVNAVLFFQPVQGEALGRAWAHPLDAWVSTGIAFLAEGKFFTLFSLLFGLGLAMQARRAEARGTAFRPLAARRLLVLLAIGLAHAFLFWWGDILVYYALLGFVLLFAFLRAPPKRLLRAAGVFALVPILLNALFTGFVELGRASEEGRRAVAASLEQSRTAYEAAAQEALQVYSSSDFVAMIPQRIADWTFATIGVLLGGMLFLVLAMFLVGAYVARRRILEEPAAHRPLLRQVLLIGGAVGLLGNLAHVAPIGSGDMLTQRPGDLLSQVGYLIGAPALSLAYAAAWVLTLSSGRLRGVGRGLAAVGRTALSNYLLQTLVMTTLAYGYGFGLYGSVGPAAGLGITLALFALQVALSLWWTARFRFGPAEWVWRALTYGTRPALRRAPRPTP